MLRDGQRSRHPRSLVVHRAVPGLRERRGSGLSRSTMRSSTGLGLTDPQMLPVGYGDHLGLRDRGEPLARLVRAQVVVELGHDRDDRLADVGPDGEVLVGCAGRSGGDSRIGPDDAGSLPYLRARSVPNDQPTTQMLRQLGELDVLDRGGDVVPLALRRCRTLPRWCPARSSCRAC